MPREFDDLRHGGLIVYWPEHEPRPLEVYGTGIEPGRWYLTADGAAAAGIELPPLRLA